MSKKKKVFYILGAVFGFILNSVFSGLAIREIRIRKYSIYDGLLGFTPMMLLSFLFIFASGFFVERVSFRTRKMSPKTSFIFTASLALAFGLIFSLIICSGANDVDKYNIGSSDAIKVFIILTTHMFGFGIGFFESKLLAMLSKKPTGVDLVDESHVVMGQGDLFITETQQKPCEVVKIAAQSEKKLNYLDENTKNMYGEKER